MMLFSTLLSLFCMAVCGWSAWINYRTGNTLWMWISVALTVWNGLTFLSTVSTFVR